jgi:hypothetical protein
MRESTRNTLEKQTKNDEDSIQNRERKKEKKRKND